MKIDANSKEIVAKNAEAVSIAKTIMDLAMFIATSIASLLNFEQLRYWQLHKREMKVKLQEALGQVFNIIVDEHESVRREWEKFYEKRLGWKVDFTHVFIPVKPEGVWRLLIIAKGLTCDKVYWAWTFPKWKYMNGSIDESVPTNIRTASEHYAVWVRDGIEPDAEFLGKSTKEVDPTMEVGMTLLERMTFEGKYFDETGKHLDIVGATFCGGSRSTDGYVPSVRLSHEAQVDVHWCYLSSAHPRFGLRRAVSLKP